MRSTPGVGRRILSGRVEFTMFGGPGRLPVLWSSVPSLRALDGRARCVTLRLLRCVIDSRVIKYSAYESPRLVALGTQRNRYSRCVLAAFCVLRLRLRLHLGGGGRVE